MQYEYLIYSPGSEEGIAATFSTDQPLPHIQAGNSLNLESYANSKMQGRKLIMQDVEIYLFVPDENNLGRVRVGVYLTDEERTPRF